MNIHYFVSHFNNAQNANLEKFSIKRSSILIHILSLLNINGYISGFKENKNTIDVYLKYPIINKVSMALVSRPSKRVYMGYGSIIKNFDKSDLLLISTKQGIITSKEMLITKSGGEILMKIRN